MQDRPDHRGADVEASPTLDDSCPAVPAGEYGAGPRLVTRLALAVAVVQSSSRPEAAGYCYRYVLATRLRTRHPFIAVGMESCCLTEREAMGCGLQRVIDRFPEFAASIRDCFDVDQSFREMCGDYAETLEALQRWQASDSPKRVARIEEYRELAGALEVEIAAALRRPSLERR